MDFYSVYDSGNRTLSIGEYRASSATFWKYYASIIGRAKKAHIRTILEQLPRK